MDPGEWVALALSIPQSYFIGLNIEDNLGYTVDRLEGLLRRARRAWSNERGERVAELAGAISLASSLAVAIYASTKSVSTVGKQIEAGVTAETSWDNPASSIMNLDHGQIKAMFGALVALGAYSANFFALHRMMFNLVEGVRTFIAPTKHDLLMKQLTQFEESLTPFKALTFAERESGLAKRAVIAVGAVDSGRTEDEHSGLLDGSTLSV